MKLKSSRRSIKFKLYVNGTLAATSRVYYRTTGHSESESENYVTRNTVAVPAYIVYDFQNHGCFNYVPSFELQVYVYILKVSPAAVTP
jgi:hypothetical protein